MPQGVLAVLGLVTGLGVLNHDLVRLVGQRVDELIVQTHTGLHFVDVLSSGSGTAERVPTDAGRIDLDFDRVVDERYHEHGCERGHTLALGVVRAHAHETVYAVLRLEITVRHVAFDIEGHGLDARFIAFLQVLDGHFIVMLLAIPHVHTHQLLGPVLCFRSAGTRHDLEHGRHLVFLMRQHVLHLQILHLAQRV